MKAKELKAKLAAGGMVYGCMVYSASGLRWGHVLAGSTLDYVVIDAEHAARDRENTSNWVLLAKSHDLTAIVRVPTTESHYVAMALDTGADGVLVPYMEDLDDVRACAATAKWHPLKGEYLQRAMKTGEFPSQKSKEYLAKRHQDHLFIVGIESVPAVNRLDEILAVPGVDGLFVGPNDLTTSLGAPDEVTSPAYVSALKTIIKKAEAKRVPVMVHQQTVEDSKRLIELGARFVLHSSDAGLLLRAMQRDFADLRQAAIAAGRDKASAKLKNTLDVV
jgi:2-keto-3-deoxy-L-rhamnonate aldolase RhmA